MPNIGAASLRLTYRGNYAAGTAYKVNDVVNYLGSSYVAVAASTGMTPSSSPAYWGLLAKEGDAGAAGATGAAGSQGPAGANGAKGDKGDKGDTGSAGSQGTAGSQGPAGAKGDTGAAGAKGDTGAAGPQGPAGATGPQGPAGADGNAGVVVGPPQVSVAQWLDNRVTIQNSTIYFLGSRQYWMPIWVSRAMTISNVAFNVTQSGTSTSTVSHYTMDATTGLPSTLTAKLNNAPVAMSSTGVFAFSQSGKTLSLPAGWSYLSLLIDSGNPPTVWSGFSGGTTVHIGNVNGWAAGPVQGFHTANTTTVPVDSVTAASLTYITNGSVPIVWWRTP